MNQPLRNAATHFGVSLLVLSMASGLAARASADNAARVAAEPPLCADRSSTPDRDQCLGRADDSLQADVLRQKVKVEYALRYRGEDPTPFLVANSLWRSQRDLTCEYQSEYGFGGTIETLVWDNCLIREDRARLDHLDKLLAALEDSKHSFTEESAPREALVELDRLYRLFRQHLSGVERSMLVASQTAWIAYRDNECVIEGGACLTELDRERIAELKECLCEPFW
jgi:uncharacterized protein YecT (DUF1311 family)